MFLKTYTSPSGIITKAHRIKSIEAVFPNTKVTATVCCYYDEADFLTGKQPLWHEYVPIPFSAIGNNVTRSMENWLVADFTAGDGVNTSDHYGIFYGGNVIADPSGDPLIYSQDKQWKIIKSVRAAKIAAVDIDQAQGAINTEVAAIKDQAHTLKLAIEAATTVPEVEAIVWPT